MKFILNKHIILFLSIILVAGMVSCKSSKSTGSSSSVGKSADKSVPSTQDQTKFAYYFMEGCKERMAGNMEIALNLFKECLKIDPNSAPVQYELGSIYRFNGSYDDALVFGKACADADPKNEWYQLLYLDCLHHKRQFAQAVEIYSRLTKNYPERAEFYEGLAAEYLYSGNYEKSFKTYEELEKKFGQNEAFTLNKIKLLKQLKKTQEAEQELKKLIAQKPDEARYYTYLAEFYQDNKQVDKAMDTYKEVLKIDPKNPMVHLAMADYYKSVNDKENFYKEVKIAFENPDLDVDTKLKILVSYYTISDANPEYTTQVYELSDLMIKIHPEVPESHSFRGDILYRDKKVKEAREEYLAAIALDKSSFKTWTQLMLLESELSDYKALEAHSEEAMELFPNQASSYYFNGVANIQLKNYQKATQSFSDGLEFIYDDKPLMIEFYSNLGNAYNYLKNYEKSDNAFDNALKIDPDNAYILNNYAYFLSLRKTNLEKAEKYSRRSNEISQNNRNNIDTYGWILYQLGRYKEAEEWLARAVKMGGTKTAISEHYGDVLYKLGRKDDALKYWKDAQESGEGSELLNKKIADNKLYE